MQAATAARNMAEIKRLAALLDTLSKKGVSEDERQGVPLDEGGRIYVDADFAEQAKALQTKIQVALSAEETVQGASELMAKAVSGKGGA